MVLLTRNAGPRFEEVLDRLQACRGIERAEILVIDSGSSDATPEIAARYPNVRLTRIPPEEFGHGRTRNLGASMARGETLVFLVQDATPAGPELLECLVAPLVARPEVAAVYGRQVARPEASPVEAEFLRQVYPETAVERRLEAGGEPVRLASVFFSNVCSALRRSVWERFPFDESLIMSEDQRWARDVLSAGMRVAYQPSAVVLHSHDYGPKKLFQRNFDSGYSLRGITQDTAVSLIRYETRFLASACLGLWRRGQGRWIPRLLGDEIARSLGFALGRSAHRLPSGLRRRLSLHKGYWKSEGAS